MSQGRYQGITTCQEHQMEHHIAQQSRRDKLKVQGFEATTLHPLDQIEEKILDLGAYEHARSTGNILSDMFNFPTPRAANQISGIDRLPPRPVAEFSGEWYGDNRQAVAMGGNFSSLGDTAADPATVQLLLMNMPSHEPHPRSAAFGDGSFSGGVVEHQRLSLSLSSSLHQLEMGGMSVIRNSRFVRAATELLEEVCSVWREQLKGRRSRTQLCSSNTNHNPRFGDANGASSGTVVGSSSSPKYLPSLSSADRFEYQRKKAKLLSMLDEVDKRYNHYCNQMQMVVNSFDSVMGFGAATPYTVLGHKAMSRHFRCIKDVLNKELKQVHELLGEKEVGSTSGMITKGETPRLRLLEQSLRQRRPYHQFGMIESEAWRPQRGLPERSVNVLRAWLFEHFLHPYPSDADKQQLARQTGLSRNQVSNWFINARVRLWKPMVEEIYQQEAKEKEADQGNKERQEARPQSPSHHNSPQGQGPEANRPESPAVVATAHQLSNDDTILMGTDAPTSAVDLCGAVMEPMDDLCGAAAAAALGSSMRLGATGDVSLTLGLRHSGNSSEKHWFYG